ncbi:hypothetical protein PLESTM_000170100 [Pleodorina starrii]|nr:hypothetical protein PLESTM_000170100 [Pleodorina starrii]
MQQPNPQAAAVGNTTTNVTVTLQECVSYRADISQAVRSGDGSAVLSAILVADNVSAVVGAVDVRDLALEHGRLGALMVSLHWLPYADQLEKISPRELEEIANATSILKDVRQGGSGANLVSVNFTDATNATIPPGPTDNLSGSFMPATALDVFFRTRLPSRGRWVLAVEDVGSGHKNRTINLQGWSLVLCPGPNETVPISLREQMAQQALGAFDLSAARAGRPFSAAALQAATGPFGARLAGQPLVAGLGTLVTREASIQYKTYSELADNAVDAAIRFENNVQSLFKLPYEPTPLIDQALPWVELLIGGTDFTIQNAVWPGKIVFYALQLEVFVRTRAAMAAAGAKSSGGDGSSGGLMRASSSAETPNCGLVDTPDGPAVINKKLLQRELCSVMMPLEYAQYANNLRSASSGVQQPALPAAAGSEGSETSDEDTLVLRDGTAISADEIVSLDDYGLGSSDSGDSSEGDDKVLWSDVSDSGLRLPTPLAPLDFTVASPGLLGRQSGGGVEESEETDDMDEEVVVEEEESEPAPAGDGRPDPRAVNRILESAFMNLDMDGFNNALVDELEVAIRRAERVSSVLDATAEAAELRLRGGDRAVRTAEALRASTDTYAEVLRAGRDSMLRFNQEKLQNSTREWLKNGGVRKEMKEMDKEGKKRGGQVNRFVFLFQRIRLTFRFSAADGFQLSFIQWVYNWGDINNILGLAQQLEKLKGAEDKGKKTKKKNNILRSSGSSDDGSQGDEGQNQDGPTVRSSDDPTATGGRTRGLLPTGETPGEWFRRVRDEANELAKGALSRIPIDHTIGINRRASANAGPKRGA